LQQLLCCLLIQSVQGCLKTVMWKFGSVISVVVTGYRIHDAENHTAGDNPFLEIVDSENVKETCPNFCAGQLNNLKRYPSFMVNTPEINEPAGRSRRITDATTCLLAAGTYGGNFWGCESRDDRPKGCYMNRAQNPPDFVLNCHESGGAWEHGMVIGSQRFKNKDVLTIRPSSAPDMCFNADGNYLGNGDNIQLWPCHDDHAVSGAAINDMWQFGNKGKRIRLNANWRKCIAVREGKLEKGQDLILWDCLDEDGQRFEYHSDDETFRPRQAQHLCVDVSGGKFDSKARIILWECNGDANQKFKAHYHGNN
jgi:hypothetical protein